MSSLSVIVRAPNWVGDAVMALGGLREVRRIVGDGRLTVAARPWVAGIFEQTGLVDDVVPVERRSWRDVVGFARTLKARSFDAAVLFQNAFEAALAARMARIPRIHGYPTDGRRFLLTDPIPLAPDYRLQHQSRYYMAIAAGFERALTGASTVDIDAPDLALAPSKAIRERGVRILADAGIAPGTPIVAINPGATNSRAKQWLPTRFADVGQALAIEWNARVVLLGSESERSTAEQVAALIHPSDHVAVLAGNTSISELIGVLAHARALISNDTGPAHIGAALGIPTVTIFGPTEMFATHPIGPHAQTVNHPVACAPCMLRDCPIDHRCMTKIDVDTVLDAVRTASEHEARA